MHHNAVTGKQHLGLPKYMHLNSDDRNGKCVSASGHLQGCAQVDCIFFIFLHILNILHILHVLHIVCVENHSKLAKSRMDSRQGSSCTT